MMAQILGVVSEFDAATKVRIMKSGRDAARPLSKARTLNDKNKVEGRKNFKDLLLASSEIAYWPPRRS